MRRPSKNHKLLSFSSKRKAHRAPKIIYTGPANQRSRIIAASLICLEGMTFVFSLMFICPPQDPRFNREIDVKTGYTTHSLVSMPVCNFDGEVIGVAQIMNKTDSEGYEFSDTDLKVFQRYLTFCGIGIQNAQLFEVSILEYKKNKVRRFLAPILSVLSLYLSFPIFIDMYSIHFYLYYSFCYLWPRVFLRNR